MNPTEPFTFVVRHRAAPQGSKDLRTNKHGGKYMAESSAAVKPFRNAVRRACLGEDGRPRATFMGPVLVGIVFEFRQAKSNTDEYPIGQNIGDLDKLTRAVLDALTQAKVIEDDRYIVGWLGTDGEPSKVWGPEDRVIITVAKAPPPIRSFVDFVRPITEADVERIRLDAQMPPDPFDLQPPYQVPKARNPFDDY